MRTSAGFFIILLSLTTFISYVNPIIEVAYATPDFQVKVGSFTKSTGAAPVTQNITGIGFSPKAIIFYFTRQTAEGVTAQQQFGVGFANGTAGERGAGFVCDDAAAKSQCGRYRSATTMINMPSSGSPTFDATAELNQLHNDGFAIRWTTNEVRADIIQYVAIGGADITNTFVGTLSLNTTAGYQSIRTLNFQPDFVMFLQTFTENADSATAHAQLGFGLASSSASQAAIVVTGKDAVGTNTMYRTQQRTGASILITTFQSPPAQHAIVSLYSMDPKGFTVNKSDPPDTATEVYFIAIKGGRFKVGSFTQPTSAGNAGVNGVGFQPAGLILTSVGNIATTGIQNHAKVSFGAASSTINMGNIWTETTNAIDPSRANIYTNTSEVIRIANGTGSGTFSTTARALFSSFDVDGFTLDWRQADTVAREILYVAMQYPPQVVATPSIAESITSSDSAGRFFKGFRDIAQSINWSDAITRYKTYPRNPNETLTTLDAVERAITLARSITETPSITESVDRAIILAREIAENPTISDTISRMVHFPRTESESLTVSDGLARLFVGTREMAEVASFADSLDRMLNLVRLIEENPTISDSIARTAILSRAIGEVSAYTDDINRQFTGARSMADIASFSDEATRVVDLTRALADSLGVADDVTRILNSIREVTDNPAFTDSIARVVALARSATDTVSLADSLERAVLRYRTADETAAFSDSVERAITVSRSLADAASAVDSLTSLSNLARSITDSATISDTVERFRLLARSLAENPTFVDAITGVPNFNRIITDSTTFTDAADRLIALSRDISQALSMSDAVDRALALSRSIADTSTLTDAVSILSSLAREITDTTTVSDVAERLVAVARSIDQALTVSDSASSLSNFVRLLTDSSTVSDTVISMLSLFRTATDVVAFGDTVDRITVLFRDATETAVFTETAEGIRGLIRSVTDSAIIADTIGRALAINRDVAQTLSISETLDRVVALTREFTDTSTFTDAADEVRGFIRLITDTSTISDTVNRVLVLTREVTQSISMSETLERAITLSRSITDSSTFTDVASSLSNLARTITDAATISDITDRVAVMARDIDQAMTVSDAVFSLSNFAREVADSASITDALDRLAAITIDIDQIIAVSETIERSVQFVRGLTETATFADMADAVTNFARGISDTSSFADTVERAIALDRVISQTLSITESISRMYAASLSMTETLTFSDAVNRIASISSMISDGLSFSDVINKGLWPQLTETLTITENVNRGLISLRSIIQSLLFVDVSSTGQGQQQPPQPIIKPPFSFFVTIQDVLGLNEEVSSHASFLRGIADQIGTIDILTRTYLSQILLTETVQVADQFARMISATFQFVELAETLNVSDNMGRLAKMTASISDNIAMNIVAQATSNIYRTITDTMSIIVKMLEAHIIGPVKQTVVAIYAPQLVSPNEPLMVNARSTSNAAVMITKIDNAANVIVQPLADVQKIAPPSSHTIVGTPVEITMTTQTNFNAKVRLYYSSEQIRTLGLQPSELWLYTFSESLQQWRPVASVVNEVEHYLETSEDITHFSKWAIMNKPVTIGLFDVVIGMGRVLPSFSRLEIVPQAQILSAVSLINMGDRQSNVVFKYWLMDPEGNTITSGIKSLSVDPANMREIPLGFPIATPGKYRVASQIIADGIESEAVTRIYDVGFLDIYGVHAAIVAAIAMVMLGLTYTERRPSVQTGKRQRFDYPL